MRRMLIFLLALTLLCPAAGLAQWWDVIPTPSGHSQELTASQLLAALNATPTPQPTAEPRQEPFTLLLLGLDNYDADGTGRSDTMVLARLDPQTGSIRLISFLRDLYVAIPGRSANRLNAAYVFGGAELLRQTLQTNFGVTFDAYVAVNFSLMADLVDQLGGVTIDVSQQEMRQVNSILKYYNKQMGNPASDQLLTEYGQVHLTGKQALCYSRIRKIDSDFQRTARQRKVLQAIFDKACALDPVSLSALALRNLGKVTTDITPDQLARLIPMALQARQASFDSLTIPVQGAYQSATRQGMSVLVPDLDENSALIRNFLED